MRINRRRIRGATVQVTQTARQLRQPLTHAEAHLWNALRNRQLAGLKFRRQHPIDRFIVDFCCPSCKLVIEVDGAIHHRQQEYDEARTAQLCALGYRVLRFKNEEVLSDLQTVLTCITEATQEQFPKKLGVRGAKTRNYGDSSCR